MSMRPACTATESIGTPVVNLQADLFTVPVNTVLKSNNVTARAAACQMFKQGSGVIMFVTAARRDLTCQGLRRSAPPAARWRTSPGTRPSSSVLLG